jgi:lipid II:glycine glycyltransferase (peptidoglycan interpeptide bridge formation enzyme)
MEIIPYEFTSNLPATFSKAFIDYLNTDVKGTIQIVSKGDIQLPLLIRKKMKFNIGYFIHVPLKKGMKLSYNEEVTFFNELSDFFKKNKQIDFIFPPLHIENFQHIPKNAKGYKLGIIAIPIGNRTKDEIFESFKPVYRRHIRNAEKSNVEIKFGLEYFDDFYTIYSEKLRQERAVHDSYETIKKIAFNSDSEIDVQCGVAYLEGKIEAGILNISDESNAYYIFGGSSKDANNGSFRYLHWELLKKYQEKGLKSYQLGAAREGEMLTDKHERLSSFKMGFGSKIQDGFHFVFIVNPIKYWFYNKLIQIKSKLK